LHVREGTGVKEQHVIHPRAVYTGASLQAALGLTKTTVAREVRLGRLRVAKRAGKYYVLGAWVLQWLEEGEVRRTPKCEVREESKV
jgi:hypothetical protein